MRKNIEGSYSAGITAVGIYSPKKVLTNDDLAKTVNTSDEWITERTGIKERHIASPDEASSDMAYQAYLDLTRRYSINPEEIDLVIVATVTPDTLFPTTANVLQDRIGASRAGAMDILAACAGFVYALSTGVQFVQSGTYKKVLVFGTDTMSRITDWEDRNTCVLFGDAAGVVLIEPVEPEYGVHDIELRSDGTGA
ncbi:MAG: beta-ketoacyl-ACP synthase 3, partial [bacterium]